jgi:hypothetical protein
VEDARKGNVSLKSKKGGSGSAPGVGRLYEKRLFREVSVQPWGVAMASTADIWRHGLLRPSEEKLKPNLECAGMYLVPEGLVADVPPELSD